MKEAFNISLTHELNINKLTFFEFLLILISFCIFITGIVGNLLVVLVVIKNSHMKTITNMFIVNLAIGDILVILICLPPTILTDVTADWYFGETMCKIIPYIQVIIIISLKHNISIRFSFKYFTSQSQ
jgi:hypothetical protein